MQVTKLIDEVENVTYNGIEILVHWKRQELKQNIVIERDYISFIYKDIKISDSYASDKYGLWERVFSLCSLIDSENFDALNSMKVNWKRIE